jgi:hypothetical protein
MPSKPVRELSLANAVASLSLRPFQEREIAPLATRKRGGFAWDMGLGKTAGACTIGARAKLKRWVILCPDNAFSVWSKWAEEGMPPNALDWIRNFWPEVKVHVRVIQDTKWNRELIWDEQIVLGENEMLIQVCTPDVFIRDWGETVKVPGKKKKLVRFLPRKAYFIPDIVIFDEAKRMRNPDSVTFQILSKYLAYYNVQHFYPMTGTPGHEPKHFWTMLHCIDPRFFRSYWKFVFAFHETIDGFFGKEILGPKNLNQWHQTLGRYFSVVKEDDEGIAEQRPPITRQLLPIEMDDDQRKLYQDLVKDMMHWVPADDNLIVAPNEFVQATRLRQALICPKILSPSLGVGSMIKDFAETVEPDERSVIFTPFTSAFEPFDTFLSQKGFRVQTLQGGIGAEERDRRILAWRQQYGTIICSILYAQAFSLEPATRCFFIGYDWDPDNNRQAEKRLHRLSTLNAISAYYYTARSTFDERLCTILNIKQQNVNLTIPSNLRNLLNGHSL